MTYTIETLRTTIRDMIPGIRTHSVFPDSALNSILAQGKRRLDNDKPNRVSAVVVGTGKRWYKLSELLDDWVQRFSTIRDIYYPLPDIAADESLSVIPKQAYRVLSREGSEYLYFYDRTISAVESALIDYTVPWTLVGVDGATETTVPTNMINALEFISAHFVCSALVSRAAGDNVPYINADIIDHGSKAQEWGAAAQRWLDLYLAEMKLDSDRPRPAISRADYQTAQTDRGRYLTHRPFDRHVPR